MMKDGPILLSSSPAPLHNGLLGPTACAAFGSSSPSLPSPSELISKYFPRRDSKLRNTSNTAARVDLVEDQRSTKSEDTAILEQSTTRKRVVKDDASSLSKESDCTVYLSEKVRKGPLNASRKAEIGRNDKKQSKAAGPKTARKIKKNEQTERADESGSARHQVGEDTSQAHAVLQRKKHWTPPPEVVPVEPLLYNGNQSDTGRASETPFRDISSFLSDYSYDTRSVIRPVPTECVEAVVTKRRKVELVSTGNSGASVPTKARPGKSPKKKPLTITEKSTAPFIMEDNPGSSGLTQYFSMLSPNSGDHVSQKQNAKPPTESTEKGKPVKKAKAPRKSSSMGKSSASKKAVLLSPEEAVASANTQSILFGTSSQLARDDSPALVRDIRKAIAESELLEESTGISTEPCTEPGISRVSRSAKSLWTAASRDSSNGLQHSDTATRNRSTDTPEPVFLKPGPVAHNSSLTGDSCLSQIQGRQGSELLDRGSELSSLILPRSLADASTKVRRSSVSPSKKSRKKRDLSTEMPNYSGFTQADLGKEVAKFGFKPIRKREEMVALLQRCWESTHRKALQDLSPNKALSGETKPPSDKKLAKETPRPNQRGGRKQDETDEAKKGASKRTVNETAVATRPRGRPRKTAIDTEQVPIAKIASPVSEVSTVNPKVSALRPDLESPEVASKPLCEADPERLFQKITDAVKAEPPTQDPSNLSFFEKILIYQPIVIEDLTIWLNTKGLSAVGIDEEVASGLVKAWCEGRSICCLWRENLRGGKRVRY